MQRFMFLVVLIALHLSAVAQESSWGTELKNKYLIHDGLTCAGWKFTGANKVERYDEIYCSREQGSTYTARVHWLNAKQFLIIQNNGGLTGGTKENRPPNVQVYELVKIKGGAAYLKEYWTGWGKNRTEIEAFKLSR